MEIFNSVPDDYVAQYEAYFDLDKLRYKHKQMKKGFLMMYAESHPVTFAYFCLGKKLRIYQAFAIDKILKEDRVALCWGRRMGKSTLVGILTFWACMFNKYPKNKIEAFTEVGIVSKEDDASKKIIAAIGQLISDGDIFWQKITGTANYFSGMLTDPNNTAQITWVNKSKVKSFPPTKKIRGNGFSILFIDEIAHIEHADPSYFYNAECLATIGDTGGKCIIASTPYGQDPNLFYMLFDPDDKYGSVYLRIWFDWQLNKSEDKYREFVLAEEESLRNQGRTKFFEQEYMALFTVTVDSFFDVKHVDKYFKENLVAEYEWHKSDCSIGVDFGISECRTVISIKTKHQGRVRLLFQYVFPVGYDINHLLDDNSDDAIPRLMQRYAIKWIIPDKCPQSESIIMKMKSMGYPVIAEDFKGLGKEDTVKTQRYYQYRSMLSSGIMESYPNPELRIEMLGLREELKIRYYCIRKPAGGYDDRIDSDLYATVPFMEGDITSFRSESICYDYYKPKVGFNDCKIDKQWNELNERYGGKKHDK